MSDSVRLHHPTLRGSIFAVETGRAYTVPFLCPTCKVTHKRKTYHLELDAVGDVVVTDVVYERLREVQFGGMKVMGRESSPEPITISMNGSPLRFNVSEQRIA